MRKDKKNWDYQPPQQVFLKENLKSDKAYSFKEIVDFMKESYPELPGSAIDSYLRSLEKIGEIVKVVTEDGPRFRNTKDLEVAVGIVQWQPKGHALVLLQDEKGRYKEENIFLSRKEASRVLNGEKIKVKRVPAIWRNTEAVGEDEGIVIEVLESKPCPLIAENVGINKNDWVGAVRPLEMMFSNSIFRMSERHESRMNSEQQAKVKEKGMILSGQLRRSGTFDRFSDLYAFFDVKSTLGFWSDYGIESKIALEWMQAEDRFYSNVLAEAHRVSTISLQDLMKDHGRKDLRNVPFVTIDGATTKDFDDAVSAKKTNEGWKVYVAIADVSRYVAPNSLLDEIAKKRTSTLYMPHKAVPMLPEILSNGVCSLNPDIERAAMVCEIDVKEDGQVLKSSFYPAIVKSHARLLYDEVDLFMEQNEVNIEGLLPFSEKEDSSVDLDKFNSKISAVVKALAESASILRLSRAQPEFDRIPEIVPVLGDNGKAERLTIRDMTPSNKLVEEFMLLTNYKAAQFLSESDNKAVLYRNQKPPAEGQTLLKSAKYESESYGHYGLGQDHYLHFTSPIRRYPDLMAHRAMKQVLGFSNDVVPAIEDVVKMGEICTEIQRLSKGASNKAKQWLILEFASRNKGLIETATVLKDLGRGWVVCGNESKISGYVPKPNSEEEQKKTLEEGLVIEIDRVDMSGEKVFINLKTPDYLLVNDSVENNTPKKPKM